MTDAEPSRPQPQYGEYANPAEPRQTQPGEEPPTAAVESAATTAAQPDSVTAGRIPGIPHNLGARQPNHGVAAGSAAPTAPPATAAEYRTAQSDALPSESAPEVSHTAPGAPYLAQPPHQEAHPMQPRRVRGDRIATVLLLGCGAFGALYLAGGMFQISMSVRMIARILALGEIELPQTVATVSTSGALAVLSLYAVALIYSVRRLRARKITFWVPLTAGLLAFMLTIVFSMIALAQIPELITALADPSAVETILNETLNR